MSTVSADTMVHQAGEWLGTFAAAIDRADTRAAVALFEDDCYWRDLVAFTWNVKTMEGRDQIGSMLDVVLPAIRPRGWRLGEVGANPGGWVDAWFTFETEVGRGEGLLRLREGKCWTLFTMLRELKGFEEKKGRRRIQGTEHGAHRNRKSWLDRRHAHAQALGATEQPYCLIVGGGQGGIALAARLRRLDVPTLVVEKNPRAGDSWRNRYGSLCLHDPVWFDHLPYLPFPDDWPVFMPKDKLGDWLEMYVKVMEIDYWGSTQCEGARFDEQRQEWEVRVAREGRPMVLRPKHLVLALGVSGFPKWPELAGSQSFDGEQLHSSQYRNGAAYAGKQCVVLGSNNSAHDICADLWEHGARVTMIQRSATTVVRSATFIEQTVGKLYSEDALAAGITTDKADMIGESMPHRLAPAFVKPVYDRIATMDAAFYDRLRAAGFLLDFGEDGTGINLKYMRRGSGYYIDVGACELVASGQIALRAGVTIERIESDSVVLTDGSVLPADLLVHATGYGSMTEWVAQLISPEVAARIGPVWGLGSDTKYDPGPWQGELRNMWKPTAQPGLWFQGGNLRQARIYSQVLALQLKARMEGLRIDVYLR